MQDVNHSYDVLFNFERQQVRYMLRFTPAVQQLQDPEYGGGLLHWACVNGNTEVICFSQWLRWTAPDWLRKLDVSNACWRAKMRRRVQIIWQFHANILGMCSRQCGAGNILNQQASKNKSSWQWRCHMLALRVRNGPLDSGSISGGRVRNECAGERL